VQNDFQELNGYASSEDNKEVLVWHESLDAELCIDS
jgi:hypothetical protein